MGKGKIMPLMRFGEIKNGQYEVTVVVNFKNTKINITEVLKEINRDAGQRKVNYKNNKLTYKSETLLPPAESIDANKKKLLFILGNPAIRSVKNGMFFFSDKNDDRYGFWGKLDNACLLRNFDATCKEKTKEYARRKEAKERRKLILSGNTNCEFVIGFTTFYSLPTPVTGKYKNVEGVESLLKPVIKDIREEEFNRIQSYDFAQNAIWVFTQKSSYDFACTKTLEERETLIYWPMFERSNKSSGKYLRELLLQL